MDPLVSLMSRRMQICFDKYWKDCNLVLALVAILDPSYKMRYLEFFSPKLILTMLQNISLFFFHNGINALYEEYFAQSEKQVNVK